MSSPADRLRQSREKAGYESAQSAAEAMGIPVSTYVQHESGVRGYPAPRAERYARFFRVAPEWLLYGRQKTDNVVQLGPQLFVKGEVQAGVWKDAWEFDADEWEVFTGRADVRAPVRERFGLRIAGASMDLIYPPGSIVECVAYDGSEQIPSGRRVVVQRTSIDGRLETTVKELVRADDGIEWLVPRSSNPSFQAFRGDEPDTPDVARIEIIAVVIGSYRPE